METGIDTSTEPPKRHLMSLTPQEWETLIIDFQSGESSRRQQWIPAGNTIAVLELALLCLLRRDFPVQSKLHILIFIEEFSDVLVDSPSSDASPSLSSFVDFVSSIFQFSTAEVALPISIKDQALVSVTSFAISLDAVHHAPLQLQMLVELLLTVVNRPNQGPDRQTRSVACECLRELENSFPCLLSDVTGHIWILSKNERTHASQSYTLLLASVVHNVVAYGAISSSVSLLSTSVPLVPFNIPDWVVIKREKCEQSSMGNGNLKEIRNVMSFLLDRPTTMTPLAIMEMVPMLMSIVSFLELHSLVSALLKVQFLGLLYSYDPVLWHVVLMLYSHFSDTFAGDEQNIFARLSLIAKESHQPLVFRLLALHWLFGLTLSRPPNKNGSLVALSSSFYPSLFDPLALKAMKLDVLAYIATHLDSLVGKVKVSEDDNSVFAMKLFEDGLVCVSAFEWLPVWSTETALAFRMLHKFLIGPVPHLNHGVSDVNILSDSTAFRTLQSTLVKLAFENRGLVPIILEFFDRLNKCEIHRFVGEKLLKKMDEHLLPMLDPDYRLHFYFPIFDKICENDAIPPRRLLVLLGKHMFFLVEKHGPDTGLRSWSQGSKVLGICRKMLLHHQSSRVFRYLSSLLAFTCQFFPDLEVRDNARIYLRMLLSIPGKKLRHTLSFGEQLLGASPSPNPASLFQVPSPHLSPFKKIDDVSSYIHIERAINLLVKQSWSIILPDWSKAGLNEDTVFTTTTESDIENEEVSDKLVYSKDSSFGRSSNPNHLLCVMDSKATQIVHILRKHFACILDFRHMPGIRIKIPCTLWFEAELFSQTGDVSFPSSDGFDELPALYASVIKFSSAAKYGSIPSCRVPFILGEPAEADRGIVALESVSQKNSSFRVSVMMELEPQEPLPGIVDVTIEANGENGQIITGSLQAIAVGMEDMFLKVFVPPDVPEGSISLYLSDLFDALWEACGNSSITGREGFPLMGGKGVAAINGTRSVKLVDIPAISLISCIEQHLAPFVVGIIGDSLIDIVRPRGVIREIVWKESFYSVNNEACALMPYSDNTPPLQITYLEEGNPAVNLPPLTRKRNMGTILIMIFMPPRFHLLFQMEVSELSTLVRIRTDHWPCLAHVDEYLEALFYS